MKINKINILAFALMFINAFLSLPVLILNIYKKKESICLISLFLAILGFFFISSDNTYDIARYYLTFTDEVYRKSFFEKQGGVIAEYLVNILLYLKLPPNLLPFISAFISYYFLLKTFKISINERKKEKIIYLFLFFLTYISIPIIGYTGIRFIPAISIFIFGVFCKKKYNKIFFPILSVFIHTSMLIPVLIFYFCEMFLRNNIKIFKVLIVFSLLMGILISPNTLVYFINKFNELNIIYVNPNYIVGYWGMEYIKSRNTLASKIVYYLLFMLEFLIIIFFNIFIYKKVKKRNKNLILFLSCFSLILYRYSTFWGRYTMILILLIFFITLEEFFKKQKNKYNILMFLISFYFIINLLYDIKKYWLSLYISYYYKFFTVSFLNLILKILENYF